MENEKTTPDGRSWYIRGYPVREESEELVGAIEVAQDVTERKKIHAKLAQSDRMASVGLVAASVAHEVNNPLAFVVGMAHYQGDELCVEQWVLRAPEAEPALVATWPRDEAVHQSETTEIVAVCDVDPRNLESAARQAGDGVRKTAEFREVLDSKDIDAVVIATPAHQHCGQTIDAVKANKHVYVEKPCSHNPWEGEMMVEASRKYDRAVQARRGVDERIAVTPDEVDFAELGQEVEPICLGLERAVNQVGCLVVETVCHVEIGLCHRVALVEIDCQYFYAFILVFLMPDRTLCFIHHFISTDHPVIGQVQEIAER